MSSRRMSLCRSERHFLLLVFSVYDGMIATVDDVLSVKVDQQKHLILDGGKQIIRADELEDLWLA